METAVSVGNTCIWQENSGFQQKSKIMFKQKINV